MVAKLLTSISADLQQKDKLIIAGCSDQNLVEVQAAVATKS